VQAGILDRPDGDTDLSRHIFADHHLTEEQRQAMMRIYLSFRHENEDQAEGQRVSTPADHEDHGPADDVTSTNGASSGTPAGSGRSGSTAAVG
jgi:hypothetical protein